MQTEYHKWYSPSLGHDMELKVYGYYGKPVLVFPSQQGRFYDIEDRGLVGAITNFIESGQIKLFSVDSIDGQSWPTGHAAIRITTAISSEKLSPSCAGRAGIQSRNS
jgi:esterase/lipase superfamily enzyme